MRFAIVTTSLATLSMALAAVPAAAQGKSSGRKAQEQGQQEIPVCQKKLGTIAVVEPDDRWWSRYNLPNPEALIKVFVAQSGCFSMVDRGKGLNSRAIERALADNGELQAGSNIGRGQVKAADYFVVPDMVGQNSKSGGGGIGGALAGALGRRVLGGVFGGVKVNKKEANVTLSLVNARTTEMERISEGYARKSDVSFRGGGGLIGGALGAISGSGYENTQIGQVIVLAYLEAYTDMVSNLGGLPVNPSAVAPQATAGTALGSGAAASASSALGVSKAGYKAIKLGMSIDTVNGILGFEGDENSISKAGNIVTQGMMWKAGSGGATIIGVFQNDKLTQKSKSGI